MLGKGKGKATPGSAASILEVVPPSPTYMEALMVDPHMFEEPLLKDPEGEVVSNLAMEFDAPVIKKVLDLLRDSTPFQMAAAVTFYSWSHSLFSIFSIFLF